jgi:hypothetical protein
MSSDPILDAPPADRVPASRPAGRETVMRDGGGGSARDPRDSRRIRSCRGRAGFAGQ